MDAWGQRCFGNGWTDRQTEMCNSRVALATENLLLCMSVCHNSCIVKEDWWAGVIKVVAIRNQTTNYTIEGQYFKITLEFLILTWGSTYANHRSPFKMKTFLGLALVFAFTSGFPRRQDVTITSLFKQCRGLIDELPVEDVAYDAAHNEVNDLFTRINEDRERGLFTNFLTQGLEDDVKKDFEDSVQSVDFLSKTKYNKFLRFWKMNSFTKVFQIFIVHLTYHQIFPKLTEFLEHNYITNSWK